MPLRKLVAQHLGYFVAYWAAAFLAWLLFTDALKTWELLFGAASSLLAAAGAEAARSVGVAQFRPRASWVAQAWRLPWYMIRDNAQVLWIVFRNLVAPQPSVLRSVVFDGGADDAGSAARRALTVCYSTVPPNTVVLAIDAAKRVMVLHEMSDAATSPVARRLGAKS